MADSFLLNEARLKFSRGKEHLKALDAEIGRFYADETDTIVCEYDSERAEYVLRFKILRPIPQHSWGLLLGDSVHNVRTALDYIAWRLAGSDPSDRRTLFPIYIDPAKFQARHFRYTRIHPDALAEIERMQPYNRPDPIHSSLWLVEELDARDKHKLITMTQAITRFGSAKGMGKITIPYAAIEQPIEDNTVLAEFDRMPDDDVNMEFEFATYVIFERGLVGDPTRTYDVIRCLGGAYADVGKVIDYFDEAIGANPGWLKY
jgi:hypothetical protein